jgi:RNA polymerase sigma-70 factor (ECF subfamily)
MTSMALCAGPAEVTDEALVAAARAGDRSAYSALVERYRDLVFAYACARLRDRDEAEDVAQEAFVRAYVALDRFRMAGCWSAWLMRIVRNLCTDAHRKRLGRATEPADDDWLDDAPTPEMVALAGERRRELRRAVAELPEMYRLPLLMHYGSGRTYREIAVALGLPESTIVGRMAGALRHLRRRMGVKRC